MNTHSDGAIFRMIRDWIFFCGAMLKSYAVIAYHCVINFISDKGSKAFDWIMLNLGFTYDEYCVPFGEVAKNFAYNCLQDASRRIANSFSKLTVLFEGKIENQCLHANVTDPAEVSNANFKLLNATTHCPEFWAAVFLVLMYVLFYHVFPVVRFQDLWLEIRATVLDHWYMFVYGEEHFDVVLEEPAYGTARTIPDEILYNGLEIRHLTVDPHEGCYTYEHLMNKPSAHAGVGHIRLVITEEEATNGYYAGTTTPGFMDYRVGEANLAERDFNQALEDAPNKERALVAIRAQVKVAIAGRKGRRLPCRPNAEYTLQDLCKTHSGYNELHVALDKAIANNRRKLRELLPLAQDAHVDIMIANYNAIDNRKKRLKTNNGAAAVNALFREAPN